MKTNSKAQYLSFLLRLWQEDEGGTWRVTLENPHNGERYGFSGLEKLYDFLNGKTSEVLKEKRIEN